jgi:Glycosyl hydrolase family 26
VVAACTALVLVLGVVLIVSVVSRKGAPSRVAQTACATASLGVYAGAGNPQGVGQLGQELGCRPVYAMDFLADQSWQAMENPSWFLARWRGSGYSMVWSVPILPKYSDASLAEGATGAYNRYFVTLATALVAGGQGSSAIRLGWEFNGNWFSWAAAGHQASFISYWRQVVSAMRSVPGAHFTFVWSPTLGDTGVGDLAGYYPGNNYVDYIGADVYDQAWASYPGAAAEFATLKTEQYGLDWLATFAAQQGKPITLPEWGLGSGPGNGGAPITVEGQEVAGGDDPTFVSDMSGWIAHHNVYEATFYDVGQSAVSSTVDPKSLAALAESNRPGAALRVGHGGG